MSTDFQPAGGPEMAEGEIVVTHPIGLHARPSVKLTQLAKTFDASIRMRVLDDGKWVDAKSIVRVMAMKVKVGQALLVQAEGVDAASAVDALVTLVGRDFDEQDAG